MAWFGGRVYTYRLNTLLPRGIWCPTHTTQSIVNATEDEETEFVAVVRRMAACFNSQGVLINLEEFIKLRRRQLIIISMAEEKIRLMDSILDK